MADGSYEKIGVVFRRCRRASRSRSGTENSTIALVFESTFSLDVARLISTIAVSYCLET